MGDPPSIDELNERFAVPGLVVFETGQGGLTRARITAPAAEAHVYLHGAHVTHHQAAGEPPLLFLSARSRFSPGAAIRGGVPLVFPWFGRRAGHPNAPDHGFARTSQWTVECLERVGGVALTFALEADDATRALWAHDFRLTYRVTVGTALGLSLEVENRSGAPFAFEEALHSYLFVGDVGRIELSGLEGASYVDKTDGMARKTLSTGPLRLASETDRVFLNTRGPCTVNDRGLGRRVIIEKQGSLSTVVWNPWSRMADLGDDQWRSMLCVEAANAMDDAVKLRPGERHSMRVVIRAESG